MTATSDKTEDRQRKIANLRRRLRRIERERDTIRRELGDSLFDFTTRCVEHGKFPVVVPVEEEEYCSGCHARLTYQMQADLQAGDISQCDNCSRILYYDKKDDC
jgi:predicted  nucleic acid-binding Zn-ribbon protein